MEPNNIFKSVETNIKGLEHQLELCDEIIKQGQQSGMQRGEGRKGKGREGGDQATLFITCNQEEMQRDIEEHFAKCINALAQRKAMLLKEVSEKVAINSMIHSISFPLIFLLFLSSIPHFSLVPFINM